MTTRVTIEPAGHKIEVLIAEGDTPMQREVLEIGSEKREFWLYKPRVMTIREIVDLA